MVTIKTVATHAGVSPSTVSRIISGGNAYVSARARERVFKAIEELHYVPNNNARRLRNNRTYSIGLLIPSISIEAYPPIIEGIEACARKHNYNIILCITNDDLELERLYLDRLKGSYVDGFLVCSTMLHSKSIYQLKRENVPFVMIARSNSNEFDAVVVDNYQGAYDGVKYLLSTGRKRIAILSGDTQIRLYQERLNGYKAALTSEGLPIDEDLIVYEKGSTDTFYRALKELIPAHTIDAIFATTDHKALVALRAINELGMNVPRDISLLGFDNISLSNLVNPPFSTISQPFHEMGRLATEKLISKIESKEKTEALIDVLKTELIIRSST